MPQTSRLHRVESPGSSRGSPWAAGRYSSTGLAPLQREKCPKATKQVTCMRLWWWWLNAMYQDTALQEYLGGRSSAAHFSTGLLGNSQLFLSWVPCRAKRPWNQVEDVPSPNAGDTLLTESSFSVMWIHLSGIHFSIMHLNPNYVPYTNARVIYRILKLIKKQKY